MNFDQSWQSFVQARRDMLLGAGDWMERIPRLLRQFSNWPEDNLSGERLLHLPLFRRVAQSLLQEFTDHLPPNDALGRLAFFERTYRFTRVGARLGRYSKK